MLNTKIKKYPIFISGFALLILVGFFIVIGRVGAQAFIQSYGAASALEQGLIVRLNPNDSSTVIPTTQTNITKTLGIVVDSSDASVAFANQNSSSQQVFVATSGHYNVLVDDQNGPINIGSYVTVSSLNGIGMNDDNAQPIVVGQALSAFDGSSGVIGQTSVSTSQHGSQTIHIGLIRVNVAIQPNPLVIFNRTILPSELVKISQEVAGKVDAPWRIYLGLILLAGTIAMVIIMLYSGIRSSLISLGRNPLSKKSITRGLIQIIFTTLIIFITGIIGVYLLLRI
ncbi:MAG TPA: hypothetical protein VMR34_05170 [Candidatus Saccharimonadales bacterium]|nr:hypothetical protein [Candidatus Saccharimonadales bacterium]